MTTAASTWHTAGAKSVFTELIDSLRKPAEGGPGCRVLQCCRGGVSPRHRTRPGQRTVSGRDVSCFGAEAFLSQCLICYASFPLQWNIPDGRGSACPSEDSVEPIP